MLFASCDLVLVVTALAAATEAYVIDSTRAASLTVDKGLDLFSRALPIGTCDPNTPCPNGACCGNNGLCGYSPLECGTGCHSNCDAKAECGQYGTPGSNTCPLDVCCSQFGFCGSTSDFCNTGCQAGYGGCGAVPKPACGGTGVGKRTIGYYESWSSTRQCQSVQPEDLNLSGFTHVNFAFAFFDPSTFQIAPMDSNSAGLYHRFTGLKDKYNGLQTWISVGGWSFTDPGPTRSAFSNMASSSGNRQKFISGLIQFMNTYGFDGVDLDWEYPGADDRGGQPSDTQNYVTLLQELKAALGSKGLTATLPTSYWYLRHFDLKSAQKSVDWFNLMAYDLHGTWDASSQFVGPYIAPHTNLTEIDLGLDLLWRAGVDANKVVLGEGWYGRSFTLKDASCNTPNGVCQFSGGADAGPCSGTSGILDYQEISDIIVKNGLTPTWDKTAGVKWITWDSNQWVSYDDADTFSQKKDFATNRCLGGLMLWAIDQMDQTASNGLGFAPGITQAQQNDANQMSKDQAAKLSCYTTDCNEKCNKGTNQVAQMNGQPGQLSTNDRCKKGQYHNLCCNDGTTLGSCQWRGYRGVGMSCIQGCADGETELATDSSINNGKKDQTCTGGLQSYCCSDFKAPPSKSDLEQKAADAAKDAAEAAAQQLALDVAAKAFCRVAVPALLAPLELAEDLIPFIGEILDLAELAATPALINVCVKGIEKEGKAEFKVFGKEHSLSMEHPEKPAQTRPPVSSHSSLPTSASNCKRADGDGCGRRNGPPIYSATSHSTQTPETTSTCRGNDWPQPCMHYSSVISRRKNDRVYKTLSCPLTSRAKPARPWVRKWSADHNPDWYNGWMQSKSARCQADEYPPAAFWQGQTSPKQYIRFAPGSQNGGAGSLFGLSFCDFDDDGDLPQMRTSEVHDGSRVVGGLIRQITKYKAVTVRSQVVITFDAAVSNQGGNWGLSANPCWPSKLVNDDPGFALLTDDSYYQDAGHAVAKAYNHNYAGLIPQDILNSASAEGFSRLDGWRKRSLSSHMLDPDAWVVDQGNSTRAATDEELERELGILRCASADCRDEMVAFGIESAVVVVPSSLPYGASSAAVTAVASTTTVIESVVTSGVMTPSAGSGVDGLVNQRPRQTRS